MKTLLMTIVTALALTLSTLAQVPTETPVSSDSTTSSAAVEEPVTTTDDQPPVEDYPPVEEVAPQPAHDTTPPPNKAMGLLVAACCVTMLLALAACVMGVMNRREISALKQALADNLDQTDTNIKKLAEETARHVNGLNDRLHATQRTIRQNNIAATPPQHRSRAAAAPQLPTVLYLAKPDENNCFSRIADHFELGNSIFELRTSDGLHGTFTVIDRDDVHRFALMMPTENLTKACDGEGIQRAAGMTRIVTDQPGTAVLDNGQWRIVEKAVIHYTA